MGNDASTSRRSGQPSTTPAQTRPQFSEVEVAELLERQKQHFEIKQQELLKTQREQAAKLRAQQAATSSNNAFSSPSSNVNSANSSFQTPQAASSNSPQASSSGILNPSSNILERARAPYSYSQSQLNPASGQSLYPNLNSVQYQTQSNVIPSSVFDYSSGHVERSMPVPSAPPAPRDRSTSRSRPKRNNERKDNEGEVKCPTCKNMYGLTIFQCHRGHSSCNDCKRTRRTCGICRQPITDMRNITLEALIAEMKVKCTYSEEGCNLFIKMADMENHTKECPFREMPCPLNSPFGCLWKGKLSLIESHFDNTHPINRQGSVDTEMTLFNLKNNSHIAHLIVLGSFNFIFHLVVSQIQDKVFMAVQLIGTNISASKWTYEVHVYNKGEPRRKYQHVDSCQPINTSINEIMSEFKCAVLPLSYASTFAPDNKMTYKFYIKKDPNVRPFGKNYRGRGGHRAQARA